MSDDPAADAAIFARFLFGDAPGWFEVRYAPGDPRDGLVSAGWFHNPEDIAIMADLADDLSDRFSDVYISSGLFSRPERKKEYALPSHIAFVDDAPPRDDYSAMVRTSQHSLQTYYRTTTALSPTDREGLQKRIAEALGGDHCHDSTRIVRFPIGENTKNGGLFPVRLEHMDFRTVYTVAELEAMFPENKAQSTPTLNLACDLNIDTLPDALRLLNADGLPRRMRPGSQGYRIASGELTFSDTSTPRYVFARSLVMHGYPDDEAMALMLHFTAQGSERKGEQWLYEDCARCIEKARAAHPDIEPHPSRTHAGPREQLRAYLSVAWEEEPDGSITYYTHDLAERLGVGERRVQTLLAELEDDGLIARAQEPGPGGRGVIRLTRAFWGDRHIEREHTAGAVHSATPRPGTVALPSRSQPVRLQQEIKPQEVSPQPQRPPQKEVQPVVGLDVSSETITTEGRPATAEKIPCVTYAHAVDDQLARVRATLARSSRAPP